MSEIDRVLEKKSADAANVDSAKSDEEDHDEAPKSFETKLSEGLDRHDEHVVCSLIQNAQPEDWRAILTNSILKENLVLVLEKFALHDCLGKLYETEQVLGPKIQAEEAQAQTQTRKGFLKIKLQLLLNSNNSDQISDFIKSPDMEEVFSLFEAGERNGILDRLVPHVNDVDALIRFTEARFDIKMALVGEIGQQFKAAFAITEKDWSLEGVRRLYRQLAALPESQVSLLKEIGRAGSDKAYPNTAGKQWTGLAAGVPIQDECQTDIAGVISVMYDDGLDLAEPENRNVGRFLRGRNEKDLSYDRDAFDYIIAHEMGHIVDTQQYVYSMTPDFFACTGWEDIGKEPGPIADFIIAKAKQPFKRPLTPEERIIARNAMALMISKQFISDKPRELEKEVLEPAYKGRSTLGDSGVYCDILDMVEIFNHRRSTAPAHVRRSFAEGNIDGNEHPYTKGNRNDMNHQIHEVRAKGSLSWGGHWFAFPSYGAQKISNYQYKAPWEDFAETYASFFTSDPNHLKLPAKHAQWFTSKSVELNKNVPTRKPKVSGDESCE
ncbi:MAG: hypothetical protein FWC40_00235 [Proteobacteria bacterium]|nr:hypothetical protein [Pseudomonadota bacterium]